MKIVFFGTPKFAEIILKELLLWIKKSKRQVFFKAVITQPDKPVGRQQILTASAVKALAEKNKIPVLTPKSLTNDFQFPSSDLAILAAYGKIIPPHVLRKPPLGFLNLHPSLLPKYRGPSPVQFALLNGERKTGITLIKMDEEVDHGPIVKQKSLTILSEDDQQTLTEKLAFLGAKVLISIVKLLIQKRRPHLLFLQNHSQATFTRILKKEDGFLPFGSLKKILQGEKLRFKEFPPFVQEQIKKKNLTMEQWNNKAMHNFIRAFYPWPGVWTILPNKKRLKLLKSHWKDGQIQLDEVQLEGRKSSSEAKFLYKLF